MSQSRRFTKTAEMLILYKRSRKMGSIEMSGHDIRDATKRRVYVNERGYRDVRYPQIEDPTAAFGKESVFWNILRKTVGTASGNTNIQCSGGGTFPRELWGTWTFKDTTMKQLKRSIAYKRQTYVTNLRKVAVKARELRKGKLVARIRSAAWSEVKDGCNYTTLSLYEEDGNYTCVKSIPPSYRNNWVVETRSVLLFMNHYERSKESYNSIAIIKEMSEDIHTELCEQLTIEDVLSKIK